MIRFSRFRDAVREFLIEHLQPEIIEEQKKENQEVLYN
jgi:hypothetical protein